MEELTPTGRELEILKVLWELGSATVRQVRERLWPNGEFAFNTVQTFLRIMDDKGLVSHKSRGESSAIRLATAENRPLPAFSSKYSTVRWIR